MPPRIAVGAILLASWFVGRSPSEEPLHVRIDRAVEAAHLGPVAPIADDAEFLRRLSLDLKGLTPSADEVRAFLADRSADKRTKAIDRMLASDRHVRRMVDWFDAVLMERRSHRWVPEAEFQAFLFDFYKSNKSYRELVRQLLVADGGDLTKRGSARFVLDRDVDPNVVTRDVARLFFGRDLQCAQCHDHPNVDDYLQSEFQGIAAFVNRSYLFTIDENNRKAAIGEKAEADVNYKSVFLPGSRFAASPRLPGEEPPQEPATPKGKEYKVKPDAKNRGVPTVSRRELLAATVARGTNVWFNRNIANRLWALMMGRGLVHPVDFQHSDNPPTNPALLDLLAADFAKGGHDIRRFLRELALTKTYQRVVDMPADILAHRDAIIATVPKLTAAERSAQALMAARQKDAQKQKEAVRKADRDLAAARKTLESHQGALADATKAFDAANQPLLRSRQEIAANNAASKALVEAVRGAQLACKALPADRELLKSLADLQAKAKKLAAATATAQATVARLAPTIGGLKAKVDAARKPYDAAAKPVDALEAQLVGLRKSHADALRQLADAKTAWRHAKRQRETAQSYVDFGRMNAEYLHQQAQLAAIETVKEKALAECRQAEAAVAARKQAAAAAAVKVEKAKQQLAVVRQTMLDRDRDLQRLLANLGPLEAAHQTAQQLASAATGGNPAIVVSARLEWERARLEVGRASAHLERIESGIGQCQRDIASATAEAAECAQQIAASLDSLRRAQALVEPAAKRRERALAEWNKTATAFQAAKTSLIDAWTAEGAVAALRPLSPDQLGWSALQATGVIANYRNQGIAELSKPKPAAAPMANAGKAANKSAAKPPEPKTPAAKTTATVVPKPTPEQVDQWVYEKLKPSIGEFIRLYGASPGTPQDGFFSAADQALFLANGPTLNSWISPSGDNVAARAIKAADAQAVAEEIYLGVLSRMPLPDEVRGVAEILARRPGEKPAAVQELIWSLLASVEFRFSH